MPHIVRSAIARAKKVLHAIGRFQSRVILTVFYVLLGPAALLYRLAHAARRAPASYWVPRESRVFAPDDFEHPF